MKKLRFQEIKSSTPGHTVAGLGLEEGLLRRLPRGCQSPGFPTSAPVANFGLAGFPTSLSEAGPIFSLISYGHL